MPQGSKGLEVYFSNPDFVFANEFATPRFGQGALAIALQALLNEVSVLVNVNMKSPLSKAPLDLINCSLYFLTVTRNLMSSEA